MQVTGPATSRRLSLATGLISGYFTFLWTDDGPFSRLSTAVVKLVIRTMETLLFRKKNNDRLPLILENLMNLCSVFFSWVGSLLYRVEDATIFFLPQVYTKLTHASASFYSSHIRSETFFFPEDAFTPLIYWIFPNALKDKR